MPAKFKEGDKVRVIKRPASPEDSAVTNYYEHMAGLTGVVENYYSDQEVAVKVDLDALPDIAKKIHKDATKKMREKFEDSIGAEQRGQLTPQELKFTPHYMMLVRAADLEKAK